MTLGKKIYVSSDIGYYIKQTRDKFSPDAQQQLIDLLNTPIDKINSFWFQGIEYEYWV